MKPARAWQRMLSGRRLDLLDPTPLDIEIQDIAHGLSFVARWLFASFFQKKKQKDWLSPQALL